MKLPSPKETGTASAIDRSELEAFVCLPYSLSIKLSKFSTSSVKTNLSLSVSPSPGNS